MCVLEGINGGRVDGKCNCYKATLGMCGCGCTYLRVG